MASITQDLLYKQSICKYAEKHGVSAAARQYKRTRQFVYFWLKRYDGTPQSLKERSRRPRSHANQHTQEELKLIADMKRRNPNEGLVVFWVKLMLKGYKRSIPGLFRLLRRQGYFTGRKKPKPKYTPKPYEKMMYPGQRVQIDVKFVPLECCIGDALNKRYYQFTAIDEYSRKRYLEGFADNSSYSAAQFLVNAVKYFGFKIECVQTDNGQEFTKRFTGGNRTNMFEQTLSRLGIRHKLIRPYTPRHNGKVERSHRKDNERFYSKHSFYSLEDFRRQLTKYNREYNAFPMRPLKWKSPDIILYEFFTWGVIYV